MAKVVTMGEIMLRLSPPDYKRFQQAASYDISYGGAEANVAASLSQFGHNVAFLSKIPNNPIGDCAIQALEKQGINCSYIKRGGNRLGIYYLENGASTRPSKIIYDRDNSAITEAEFNEFNFNKIFQGVDLFHVSGITPVINEKCTLLTIEAMKSAKQHGAIISFDLNYRTSLWKDHIQEKQKSMERMMKYTDICFGNALDAAKCLGYRDKMNNFFNSPYDICINAENMAKVVYKYNLLYLVTTIRNSISASDNELSAAISDGTNYYKGKNYSLHIVDRIGGGDAFAAGFLHGYLTGKGMQNSLEYGIAASAIKHTITGDMNNTTIDEVETLVRGDKTELI